MSKMLVKDLSAKLRTMIGDSTIDIPDDFVIGALNWSFNDLPMVPKLEKLFSKHKQFTLDAKGHYKWNLNNEFRRILDIPMLEFYTSTGGDICRLGICHQPTVDFYKNNGIINLKQAGRPCEYTIETEGDEVWLVLDRPSDVPIIIDYIFYGIPKPVSSMEDEIDISAIAENLILDVMRTYWLREADDYAFAADITSYLDNKKIIEAIQSLHRKWGVEKTRVLGEV